MDHPSEPGGLLIRGFQHAGNLCDQGQTVLCTGVVAILQVKIVPVTQEIEIIQIFGQIVSGEADGFLFVNTHPGKVTSRKIDFRSCVVSKSNTLIQLQSPISQRSQFLPGSVREKIHQRRGVGRINPQGRRRFLNIVQKGSAPDPQGEQCGDSKRDGRDKTDTERCFRFGRSIQHQEEQQGHGNKLCVEIQKAVEQKDSEQELSAESPFRGSKTAPQSPEEQTRRNPADIQKKLKQLVMHMLYRIDPGLERTLQPAIACVSDPQRMPENYRDHIPGIQKAAD